MSAAYLFTLAAGVAAWEPSRLIDARILVAIDYKHDGWEEGERTPRSLAEELGIEYLADRMENSHASVWRHLPHVTTSLDAAVKVFAGDLPEMISSTPKLVASAALEQRAELTLRAELAAEGVTIDKSGGNCPVQIEGQFDGLHFYFRARGQTWQFHVAERPEELLVTSKEIRSVIKAYHPFDGGDPSFAAGWMAEAEALLFVLGEVRDFRALRTAGKEQPKA